MPYQWCLPPLAWTAFTLRYMGESLVRPGHVGTRDQLKEVNDRVNQMPSYSGKSKTEEWLIWPHRAWCHDYAVTKRSELFAMGWPSSSLLLAECFTSRGEGHMVLIADGLVLDNLRSELLAKTDTGYDWSLAEQQADDPNHWARWQ